MGIEELTSGQSRNGMPPSTRQLKSGDRIVIAGAGPAGLTAGYILVRAGYKVTVVEADDVVGGISRTARYKDYRFDIGGHRFFTKITPVENLWEEILGEDFIRVPRLSRILYNGKFFHYPLRALNAVTGLGPIEAARIILSYLKAQVSPHAIEENFEQWVSNRFGERLYRIFFRTYTEKVWGIPCTEIRATWAAQRIQGLSLAKAILNATSLNRRAPAIKTLIAEFHYPRLGPGQMWEACAQRIEEMGGSVLSATKVTGFERNESGITAAIVNDMRGSRRIEGEHFISTMPLSELAAAVEGAPQEILDAGRKLSYRDFVLVALILDRERIFPDNWIYVHTPGVLVGRIQNFNNWSPAMVPVPGRTCVGMEYFCFRGDELWEKTDDELIALASSEFTKLRLAPGANIVDGAVVRMPKAYPIYDSDYEEHVETISSMVKSIPNLHSVGRNGMHKYNNQDHSMYTAMLTVENMTGADHDVWEVNTDLEYHEEQRLDSKTPSQADEGALR